MRRAVKNLDDGKKGQLIRVNSNGGFRAYRLSFSNFKIWEMDKAPDALEALEEQLKLYADNVSRTRGQKDILSELVLKSGLPLSAAVEQIDVAGMAAWSVASGDLLICLEKSISREALRALLVRKPKRLLCLDTAFGTDDALKTNTVLEAKSHGVVFHTV